VRRDCTNFIAERTGAVGQGWFAKVRSEVWRRLVRAKLLVFMINAQAGHVD